MHYVARRDQVPESGPCEPAITAPRQGADGKTYPAHPKRKKTSRSEPPSWAPGGKGEFNFEGKGLGDGRWFFVTGGCWFIRTQAIRALDWPDPGLVKRNDDVLLCEALRQQGWEFHDIGVCGAAINTEPRRGDGEDKATMQLQMATRQG